MPFKYRLRSVWQSTIGKPKDLPVPSVKISEEDEKAAVRERVRNVTQKLAEIPIRLMEEDNSKKQ